jgi:hypothetical protein
MVVDNAPIGRPRLGGPVVMPGSAERAVLVAAAGPIRTNPVPRPDEAPLSASQREDPHGWYRPGTARRRFHDGSLCPRAACHERLGARARRDTRLYSALRAEPSWLPRRPLLAEASRLAPRYGSCTG